MKNQNVIEKKQYIKNMNGITLIALIITIVVLLILAVVAIGQAQETNIVGYAQNAATEYEKRKNEETDMLKEYEKLLQDMDIGSLENKFFGPIKTNGDTDTWFVMNEKRATAYLVADDHSVVLFSTVPAELISIQDAINLIPDIDIQEVEKSIKEIETQYGKIDACIITEGGENGKEIFGLLLSNQTKIYSIEEKQILEYNSNPSEYIKEMIYRNHGSYEMYRRKDAGENIISMLMLSENNKFFGSYNYNTKQNIAVGVVGTCKVTQIDSEFSINDGDIVIKEGSYKIALSSVEDLIYIVDKGTANQKVYQTNKSSTSGEELTKTDFDITKLGHILQ